jgi:hypothetical protein
VSDGALNLGATGDALNMNRPRPKGDTSCDGAAPRLGTAGGGIHSPDCVGAAGQTNDVVKPRAGGKAKNGLSGSGGPFSSGGAIPVNGTSEKASTTNPNPNGRRLRGLAMG